jgi:hypothetical protein
MLCISLGRQGEPYCRLGLTLPDKKIITALLSIELYMLFVGDFELDPRRSIFSGHLAYGASLVSLPLLSCSRAPIRDLR